jgi:PPOX class probable F420-dependent enzyme
MTSLLPDPGTDFGARVACRLQDEPIAWLTVVDAAGMPQPAPIWFLWDGDSALIYSHSEARRRGHLRANPRAALHLDGDGLGGDVVVLTGEVVEVPDEPPVPGNPAYLAKYGGWISDGPWRTPEVFAQTYSVPLRFRPRRVRGH